MAAPIDIAGDKFGKLLVIRRIEKRPGQRGRMWLCRCECGNEIERETGALTSGNTRSCGCLHREVMRAKGITMRHDLLGMRFGRLVVVKMVPEKSFWLCQCDCGNEKTTRASSLLGGCTKSCGCLDRENRKALPYRRMTHRLSKTPEYLIWRAMLHRCNDERNRAYERYGGRGIKVCERWQKSFTDFIGDVGKRPSSEHSLDRFPNKDGNYEPANVRWATRLEQAANKSKTHFLEHNGERLTITQWANRLGIPRNRIRDRLDRGWSIADALARQTGWGITTRNRKSRQATPFYQGFATLTWPC